MGMQTDPTDRLIEVEPDEYLRQCVRIEPLAIQEEYVRLPSDLAYWNARYASALRQHMMAKIESERVAARLRIELREQLLGRNAKVTESMVDSAVETHPDWQTARLEEIDAEVRKVQLHGVLDALRTKREMLISLGAHVRKEMDHDPAIRREQRDARRFPIDEYGR